MAWKRRYACAWLRSSSRRRFRTRCSISGRPSASNSASTSSQQPLQLPELVAAERALNETRNCGVALAELERALSIAETVRAAPLLRSIRCRIADVHHLSGNYVAECKQLELAVGDRDRDHDNGVEDVLLRALNVAKLRTGAEPTPLDDDDERETTSVTRLCNKAVNALVLWESDDRDSARHKLDAAIDAAKATTDARRLAAFLQVLRSHWGLVSGVPTALEDAEQAVEVLREDTSMAELPDDRGLLVGLQTLGQAQMKLLPANQRTKHAQDTLTEALKLAETKYDERGVELSECLRLLSSCYKQAGDPIVSEGLLRTAISKLRSITLPFAVEKLALLDVLDAYQTLLRQSEWNGRSRAPEADRLQHDANVRRRHRVLRDMF